MRRLAMISGIVATLAIGIDVRADVTKAECVKANAEAQTLRINGRLSAAREKLTLCEDPLCPGLVRDDCTQRLDELERIQPTIVFEVKNAAGEDVSAVTVTIDGQPLASKLAGTAVSVDPGEHAFRFSAEGQPALSRTFVIHEGEKERRELIQFAPAPVASGPSEAPLPGTAGLGTQRILAFAAGGLGIAAVAVGSVFGIESTSATSSQKSDCASASSCANHGQALSDHSTAVTDGTISTVAFVAGGALLIGGVTLFFTARKSQERASGTPTFIPSVAPGSAFLSLRWKL